MHKFPQNQSYVGSSGQTLTTDVSMTLCSWQIYHQTHVLCARTTFVPNQIRYQINTVPTPATCCSLDKGVADTGGGGEERQYLIYFSAFFFVLHVKARGMGDGRQQRAPAWMNVTSRTLGLPRRRPAMCSSRAPRGLW